MVHTYHMHNARFLHAHSRCKSMHVICTSKYTHIEIIVCYMFVTLFVEVVFIMTSGTIIWEEYLLLLASMCFLTVLHDNGFEEHYQLHG